MKDKAKLTEALLSACPIGLADYFKSEFNKLDLSKIKKITCKNSDDIPNLQWLIKRYAFRNLELKWEDDDGSWMTWEYNSEGLETYYEDSRGYWVKTEYNEKGLKTQSTKSNGRWKKWEYVDSVLTNFTSCSGTTWKDDVISFTDSSARVFIERY